MDLLSAYPFNLHLACTSNKIRNIRLKILRILPNYLKSMHLCQAHNFLLMVGYTEEIHDTRTEQSM